MSSLKVDYISYGTVSSGKGTSINDVTHGREGFKGFLTIGRKATTITHECVKQRIHRGLYGTASNTTFES